MALSLGTRSCASTQASRLGGYDVDKRPASVANEVRNGTPIKSYVALMASSLGTRSCASTQASRLGGYDVDGSCEAKADNTSRNVAPIKLHVTSR
ncbi:UNVERIFIED_CONTAM: hypothetical protein Sangu_1178300 [Sesamum angustifolium]|uniref:Uncharacterized protein n=1 Tax=Sesamum angustifolium TaxID=2727405 RepID=A0AAW2NJH2_9LAMI